MLTNSHIQNIIISYIVFQVLIQELHLNGAPACPLMLIRVILEDVVHLLEGAALGFGNKEVGPDTG